MTWKFCPHCKGNLIDETDESHGKCATCNQIWYKTPPPATIALIVKENKILLSKRGINPHKGKWDFPGGFIREGESAEESMRREIEEELQVSPTSLELFATAANPGYQYLNELLMPLDVIFKVKLPNKKITPSDDVSEVKWFSLDGDLPDLAFSHTKAIIQKLIDA